MFKLFANQKKRTERFGIYAKEWYYQFQEISNSTKAYQAWEYILLSALLSCGFGFIARDLPESQSYPQLTVGNITWSAASKDQDYALLLGIVFGFFGAYIFIQWLSSLIWRNNGESSEKAFRSLCALATIPAFMWLGGLFISKDENFGLLLFSSELTLFVLFFSIVVAFRKLSFASEKEYTNYLGINILILLNAFFGGIALELAYASVNPQLSEIVSAQDCALYSTGAALLALLGVWLQPRLSLERIHRPLILLLLLAQVFIPLCFLTLLAICKQGFPKEFCVVSVKSSFYFLVGGLIVVAYLDLAWRFKNYFHHKKPALFSAISPFCLIAILLFVKLRPFRLGFALTDDYHAGEYLLPWWLWKNFNYLPFQDYTPARGLINYVPGFLADIFFDGTATAHIAAFDIMAVTYLIVGFLAIARLIGVLPSFMVFLLMPLANGIAEIDLIVTLGLCFLCLLFLKRRYTSWLLSWVAVGTVLLLFAPGQAGLLLVATTPLALVAAYQALRYHPQRLLVQLGISCLVAIVLAVVTPIDEMLFGAIRYGAEQSKLNSISYGISWSASDGSSPNINQLLWEVIRASWLIVAITAGVFTWQALFKKNQEQRRRVIVFALPITILLVLFIVRAAGRIDPGFLSRLGIASLWSWSLLLPILLWCVLDEHRKPLGWVVTVFASSLLAFNSDLPASTDYILEKSASKLPQPAITVDSKQIGLPNLGVEILEPEHIERLRSIQRVLSYGLDSKETYLDLTNRTAHYFYLGYAPPVADGAFYNLVTDGQQLRAVQKLLQAPPPIALISADNTYADEVPPSLRSHLIYRFLVERYTPVKIDKFVYLVRPDRLPRFQEIANKNSGKFLGNKIQIFDQSSKLSLLDEVFSKKNLLFLPVAWGRSFDSLKPQLQLVRSIDKSTRHLLDVVESGKRYHYQVTGQNPTISFSLENLNLSGRDAGILGLDFACSPRHTPQSFEVTWQSPSLSPDQKTTVQFDAKKGRLLVPLDAVPSWLLATKISQLQLKLLAPNACRDFSITNVQLFQRATVLPALQKSDL